MPLAVGAKLGPYEVVDLVGAGGMGEVYRARDPRLGREVAVKVLPSHVASSPERLKRFEREARAAAALNHPNILTVYDVGTARVGVDGDGAAAPYVVTELLHGESLRELLRRRSPTQRQTLSLGAQVAQGLEAAHARGLVHRDVKPENLFVTTDGRVKVLDFGLAKLADGFGAGSGTATDASPTAEGEVVGTLAYMSPEQIRGLPLDRRTDIFSLGLVLYEMLEGRHPFRRDSRVGTLSAILDEDPPQLGASAHHPVPPAVAGIVRRCLQKDREERFASARDLAFALEAVLQAPAGAARLEELEERSPYPGLACFTERDTAVFFGREPDVAGLWEKLRRRRLLAVIGPSGAGKSSFLRAGVVPARPRAGCGRARRRGPSALGLARALTPAMAGDAETIGEMLAGVSDLTQHGNGDRLVEAVKRWRAAAADALLVVDERGSSP
ncbi:MAG: protein kinase [Vicinamibacteria bacterium]